jgi:hypothetical protein
MKAAAVGLAVLAILADWYTTKRALLDAPLRLRERNGVARWIWARLGIPRGREAAFQARALWGMALLDAPAIGALVYAAPRAPGWLLGLACGAVAFRRFEAAWGNRDLVRRKRAKLSGRLP